jgi:hypothetical protein
LVVTLAESDATYVSPGVPGCTSGILVSVTTLVGAGLGLSSLIEMSDLPQRVQYFRIGLFALPQLAQVLNEYSSPLIHAL